MAQEELIFSGIDNAYGRMNTMSSIALSDKMKQLYHAEDCIITVSGMASISTAIQGIILYGSPQDVVILYDKELYSDTEPLFQRMKMIYSPRITIVEADLSNARELFKNAIEILCQKNAPYLIIFAESVSNPSGRVFAFEAIKEIREYNNKHKIPPPRWTTIIDNTWTSVESINPFDYGIDCVCVSLTKYYSGGSVIGGAILTKVLYKSKYIMMMHKSNGYHMSPHDSQIILREIDGLRNRLESASRVATNVMCELAKRNIQIMNPIMQEHETHDRAMKMLKYVPPIFCVFVKLQAKEAIFDIFRKYAPKINIKTSYGGKDSRICNYPKRIGDEIRLRISIGYENQDINELVEMIYTAIIECKK